MQQQGPNWIKTLILLAVFSTLGLAYMGYEYWYKPGKEDKEEAAKRLFTLDGTSIESIEIDGGGKSFVFHCLDLKEKMCKPGDQSNWEMTEPMKTSADKANVNSVLSTVKNLSAPDIVDLSEDSPEKRVKLFTGYGLDEEARRSGKTLKLTLKVAGGQTQTVHLGGTHPIGGKIFAVREIDGALEESKVYLVPSYFKNNFEKDLTYWRNKDLVKFSVHRIGSLHLETPRLDVEIEKVEGSWDLKVKEGGSRVSYTGDVENVDGLLTSLNYLKAKSFPAESKSSYDAKKILANSRKFAELTVRPKTNDVKKEGEDALDQPFTITLYEHGKDEAEKVYATVSHLDPLYELDKTTRKRVDKTLKDLRLSRLLTAMQRFSAKRITFSGKTFGGEVVVSRGDDDSWAYQVGANMPDGRPSQARIDRVLDQLSGNHIKEFLPASRIPAGEESGLKVFVGDDNDPKKTQLVFWKKGETLYARDLKSARKEAFELASSVGEALPWDKASVGKDPENGQPAEADAPAGGDGHGHGHGHGPDDGHGH